MNKHKKAFKEPFSQRFAYMVKAISNGKSRQVHALANIVWSCFCFTHFLLVLFNSAVAFQKYMLSIIQTHTQTDSYIFNNHLFCSKMSKVHLYLFDEEKGQTINKHCKNWGEQVASKVQMMLKIGLINWFSLISNANS